MSDDNDGQRVHEEAYIGLGSNLQLPVEQLQRAFEELARLPGCHLTGRSTLYESRPVGPPGQPDYVNAVARILTRLAPLPLLHELRGIERAHQRVRGERWGPRTLDLDLLLYGQSTIETTELRIPHPRLHQRSFVLYPLYEISPALHIPGRGALSELIADCPPDGLRPVR